MALLGFSPGSADGFASLEGSHNGWGYVLGATFSVTEDTNIALSYRSKVEHDISNGKATFDMPANVAGFLATQAPGTFVNSGGKATLTLPASATLSITHRVNDRWTVMGDVSRTAWAPGNSGRYAGCVFSRFGENAATTRGGSSRISPDSTTRSASHWRS